MRDILFSVSILINAIALIYFNRALRLQDEQWGILYKMNDELWIRIVQIESKLMDRSMGKKEE